MTSHPLRTGGQILVDQLRLHGSGHVFCVPGESYLAALDAMHDAEIAITVCRQEGGADVGVGALVQAVKEELGIPDLIASAFKPLVASATALGYVNSREPDVNSREP